METISDSLHNLLARLRRPLNRGQIENLSWRAVNSGNLVSETRSNNLPPRIGGLNQEAHDQCRRTVVNDLRQLVRTSQAVSLGDPSRTRRGSDAPNWTPEPQTPDYGATVI